MRTKKLKLFSYLLISLAAMDAVLMFINCFYGQEMMLGGSAIEASATSVALAAIILYGIGIAVNLFLADKGLGQAYGVNTGSSHIVFVAILLVLSLLGLLMSLFAVIKAEGAAADVLISLLESAIYCGYLTSARAVKHLHERRNRGREQ